MSKLGIYAVATLGVALTAPVVIAYATIPPVVHVTPGEPTRIVFSGTTLPRPGRLIDKQREVKSILNIRAPIEHGQFVWDEKNVPAGRVWLRVDLQAQTISVFRSGHEIGTAVILYGATEKPTPVGTFAVLAKRRDHRSSIYDASMPYTLRLTNDGISIHGSNIKMNAVTHGCVGVPIEFAKLLFGQVKVGDQVDLVNNV